MTQAQGQHVAIAGGDIHCRFATDAADYLQGLSAGRVVEAVPYFTADTDLQQLKLSENPLCAPLPEQRQAQSGLSETQVLQLLIRVIDTTLSQSGLTADQLRSKRVRVYCIGSGLRSNLVDFLSYMDRNDPEDLLFFPEIKNLHAAAHAQDRLHCQLVRHYQLAWPPVPVLAASSSAMAALHMAQAAIRSDQIDLALLCGWSDLPFQEMLFFATQNLLTAKFASPFCGDDRLLPASSVCALLLESEQHAARRGVTHACYLDSCVSYQSSGARGGNSFSADFRAIANTLTRAMQDAGVEPDAIAFALPHGNGSHLSDQAECMALRKVWGDNALPVASYKWQTGYMLTCNVFGDLLLACDALQRQSLPAYVAQTAPEASLHLDFHVNRPALTLHKRHMVKSSLGVDGSVFASVIRCARPANHARSA